VNIQPNPDGTGYLVTLSARNLQTLQGLYQLALQQEAVPAISRWTENGHLTVLIEPDVVHYDRPEGGPGEDSVILAGLDAAQQ
jgi:hypothetical protein